MISHSRALHLRVGVGFCVCLCVCVACSSEPHVVSTAGVQVSCGDSFDKVFHFSPTASGLGWPGAYSYLSYLTGVGLSLVSPPTSGTT